MALPLAPSTTRGRTAPPYHGLAHRASNAANPNESPGEALASRLDVRLGAFHMKREAMADRCELPRATDAQRSSLPEEESPQHGVHAARAVVRHARFTRNRPTSRSLPRFSPTGTVQWPRECRPGGCCASSDALMDTMRLLSPRFHVQLAAALRGDFAPDVDAVGEVMRSLLC